MGFKESKGTNERYWNYPKLITDKNVTFNIDNQTFNITNDYRESQSRYSENLASVMSFDNCNF